MFRYRQTTGEVFRGEELICKGYSGYKPEGGCNNPSLQTVHDVGPIPRGDWVVAALIDPHPQMGPFVLVLTPKPETQTFGRSGFLIHGDSISHPGEASHGCIILPRQYREEIWHSGDRDLQVTL